MICQIKLDLVSLALLTQVTKSKASHLLTHRKNRSSFQTSPVAGVSWSVFITELFFVLKTIGYLLFYKFL
jgi:hypothetical protein